MFCNIIYVKSKWLCYLKILIHFDKGQFKMFNKSIQVHSHFKNLRTDRKSCCHFWVLLTQVRCSEQKYFWYCC